MDLLAGTIVQGLAGGCVIALLAAGVTIVYRSTGVLNFAQGSLATLSTYAYYQLTVGWGAGAAVALPIALVVGAASGLAAEQIAIHPLRNAPRDARAAGTIGLVLIVQWVVTGIWGADQRFLPALADGGVEFAGTRLGAQQIALVVATLAVGAAVGALLTRTRGGLALAASADDARAVELLGVSPRTVSRATMALAGVVGALAGVLATPLLVLTPSQMTLVFVVSLGAALAGSFRSLPRTVAAGLGLGVVQALVTAYAPSSTGLSQAAGALAVLGVLAVVRSRLDLAAVMRGRA